MPQSSQVMTADEQEAGQASGKQAVKSRPQTWKQDSNKENVFHHRDKANVEKVLSRKNCGHLEQIPKPLRLRFVRSEHLSSPAKSLKNVSVDNGPNSHQDNC